MPSEDYVEIPGSQRKPHPGAIRVGPAEPNERAEVTVVVRANPGYVDQREVIDKAQQGPLEGRLILSHEEVAEKYGASTADLNAVVKFASEQSLTVVDIRPAERRVRIAGRVEDLSRAFQVELEQARLAETGSVFRHRVGSLYIPAALDGIVTGVFGLDNRPQGRPAARVVAGAQPAAAGRAPFTALEAAQLYNFPTGVTGAGECIGIIVQGGGFRPDDLSAYFKGLGIAAPTVVDFSVDGGQNAPSDTDVPEATLDISVAGAVAPGARIVAYFTPNSSSGVSDAVSAAINDLVNRPSILSLSWTQAEAAWTSQVVTDMELTFAKAAAQNITIFAASGDWGSGDSLPGNNVGYPASSRSCVGCGGTRLLPNGSELVWNDPGGNATGGGISTVFHLPDWQANANVPGANWRGVPDVAADAATGYRIVVDGKGPAWGGTSAVAPLWAGLIALLNEALGRRVGALNSLIYKIPASASAFRDITAGNNGTFIARPGWDACTGLGSPDGAGLLAALRAPQLQSTNAYWQWLRDIGAYCLGQVETVRAQQVVLVRQTTNQFYPPGPTGALAPTPPTPAATSLAPQSSDPYWGWLRDIGAYCLSQSEAVRSQQVIQVRQTTDVYYPLSPVPAGAPPAPPPPPVAH